MFRYILFLIAVLTVSPTYAINKCKGSDGAVIFQDAPCQGKGEKIDVKPAAGVISSSPTENAGSDQISRMKESLKTLENRRISDEKLSEIQFAKNKLQNQISACDREQNEIRERMQVSNNNLAGQTRNVAISQEMTAAATTCSAKVRLMEQAVDLAEKACSEVKCRTRN